VSAAEVQEVVETVVQVAVRCTDDAFDPGGANTELQAALGRLIEPSGLTVIQPQPREAFDDNRHTAMGNKHAPSPQLRWRIAAVRRRGLERAGKVVAKAEVSLFD
jgi:molecular chaperone GrpE (heat shock protein)